MWQSRKRAYAVIMRGNDREFLGVLTVVDTMEKAEELCERSSPTADYEYLTWTPTFYEGEE